MFSWFSGLKRPSTEAGKLCFDLVNQIRARQGHNIKQVLPESLGGNPEFIGILLGIMDVLSTKTNESNFLKSNTTELFQSLFGLEPNSDDWSKGMINALELMESGSDNAALLASLERTENVLLESDDMEQELHQMLKRFF